MTLREIKKTAFAKWLMMQSREQAVMHLCECIYSGQRDSLVWDLIEAVYGKRVIKPPLGRALGKVLDALEGKK